MLNFHYIHLADVDSFVSYHIIYYAIFSFLFFSGVIMSQLSLPVDDDAFK